MKIDVFILNYNGKELLAQCLPSVSRACEKSRYAPSLIVVDNVSRDDSESYVREHFPRVRFMTMAENRVLCSFNDAATQSNADIVLFLNNDLRVDEDFIDPLIDIFREHPETFLAAARVYNFTGDAIEEGKNIPLVEWGLVKGVGIYKGFEKDFDTVSYTFQAGFGAFDRTKFLALGGYDPLYLPGILEDTDLCFRAWKRGFTCYYQPASRIYHMGKASFTKRFGNRKLLAISHRNTYFFILKNIRNKAFLCKTIFFFLPRICYACVTRKWEILWGAGLFFCSLPKALSARRQERLNWRNETRSEEEVFSLFRLI